jgi:uncharacterized Ntn-hydrolase superfamily protein
MNCRIIITFLFLCLSFSLCAQNTKQDILTHTYSIVARDSVTGDIGVAVQSGLALLKEGKTAPEVLNILIGDDDGREFRQLAIIDINGNVAAFTGKKCIPDAGQILGKNFSVQANMMLNKKIWPAMAEAFENSTGPLAERMVEALKAAEAAGGDIRGQQSASILVVRGSSTGKLWEDRLVDLRVKEYSTAEKMFPDNLEMKYWHAVSLANMGKVEEALPIFKIVFEQDPNWIELTRRIVPNGLLKVDDETLEKIVQILYD